MAPMAGGEPMRCGGCGAKVGAEVLAGALADLPRLPGADVLIGLDAPDDAAVMLPPPGMAVVQSVDHFRAFIDDPFVFGQIAAAHALSDLHAMGARPWTALAVAAVPYTSGDEDADRAGRHAARARRGVLAADGCALVGGHSAEAAEPALGFRGHRPGRSGEAAAQVGAAAGRRAGADQAARHRHRAGGSHARSGARGLAAGGDRIDADEQRDGVTDPARVRRGGVHRRHRLRPGGASAGDAARIRCRRGAVARSPAGVAGRAGTCGAWRGEHAGGGEPPVPGAGRMRAPRCWSIHRRRVDCWQALRRNEPRRVWPLCAPPASTPRSSARSSTAKPRSGWNLVSVVRGATPSQHGMVSHYHWLSAYGCGFSLV